MAQQLSGKVAVVTGSTSGIGAAIAQRLAADGARVVVSGRREDAGQAVVEAIVAAGGQARFQRCDLRSPDDCRALCDAAGAAYGGLDVLVNNAGIFPRASLEETTPELWDDIMVTNLRGPFLCAQAALPYMRQRGGGCIINVGSGNAYVAGRSLLAYGVSKGALLNLTMNLAKLLAPDHIRVNWLTVGWVLTEKEYEVQAGEGRSATELEQIAERLPWGQFNTPDEYGAACAWLASDEARHVTGCELNSSAGLTVRT